MSPTESEPFSGGSEGNPEENWGGREGNLAGWVSRERPSKLPLKKGSYTMLAGDRPCFGWVV